MRDRQDDPTVIPTWWSESPQAEEAGAGYEPAAKDELINFVQRTCWDAWDMVWLPWEKQVEENIRLLSGRHYDAFIATLGDFVDLSRYFASGDDRWREQPVFNWVAHYYKRTLSKLTENMPTLGVLPAGADYSDAILAQVVEPVWRYEWWQMEMPELAYPLYGWIIVGARARTRIRWDPDRGPQEEFRGPAMLQWFQNGALTQRQFSDAPYIRNTEGEWRPHVLLGPDGQPLLDDAGTPRFGKPYTSRLGDLAFDVLVPTSVRTPYGPEPDHRKAWYTHEYWLPVEEIKRRFGVTVEPDDIMPDDDLSLKLSYAAQYGHPHQIFGGPGLSTVERVALRGFKRVVEHWRREVPNDPLLSRGRTLVVCKDEVLYDDINPYWVDGSHEETVMPFDAWDVMPVPGRNEGMGDLEIIGPINKAINRRMGAMMDAVDYFEQPTEFYNENIIDDEAAAHIGKPGSRIPANMIPSLGAPMFRMPAADLPKGSVDLANLLQNWMQMLGSQPYGSEGFPVTTDASGELQREVRFDTDRVWGATIRLHSYGWARLAQKMVGILAACMDDDRLLTISGEDQAAEFVQVAQDMFKGRVNIYPHPESQVLESRQEKQNRIMALVGVGLPIDQALQALNYPDLNRVLRPGGPAYAMASRENLELTLGQMPPVLPEHDHPIHIALHRKHMQTIAFRDADPQTQARFRIHLFVHEQMLVGEAVRQQSLMAPVVQGAQALGGGPEGPGQAGTQAGNSDPDEGSAPRGADLEQGRVAPGAADPRRASITLAR